MIAWYDNIPLFSWIFLKGSCRTCKEPISFLYPFIEVLTALLLFYTYIYLSSYFVAYFIFFSALIVTIRSDIETMMISRFVTLFLAPIGILCSFFGLLPISFIESISGALCGYTILFIINKVFKYFRGIDGIGEGDFDLLFFIGSFIGTFGCWITILFGSLLGTAYSIFLLIKNYTLPRTDQLSLQTIKIPFGPFLALGAIIFTFLQKQIFYFFLA